MELSEKVLTCTTNSSDHCLTSHPAPSQRCSVLSFGRVQFYHECTVLSLLAAVMYNKEAVEAAGDSVLDLAECVICDTPV